MRKLTYHSGGDFAEEPEPFFTLENECYFCGNRTRTAIDRDSEYDRTEAKYWERKYKALMSQMNSLLRYVETETGWNPAKDRFIKEMVAIRDKLCGLRSGTDQLQ